MLFSNRIDTETCNQQDTCLADTYNLPATCPTETCNLPNNKPATCQQNSATSPTELCNLPTEPLT